MVYKLVITSFVIASNMNTLDSILQHKSTFYIEISKT